MNRIPVAIALGCALFWTSAANADCKSELQCDGAGNCAQVEICDDVLDMVQASPDTLKSTPAESRQPAVTPVAAAVAGADGSCREVEICGTTQVVCD